MSLADNTIAGLVTSLAARTPAPGGGAAAAIAGALGAASGAMAARFTSGAKYAEAEREAQQLASELDGFAHTCLALADEDAAAFAMVRAASDPTTKAAAELAAARIPLRLMSGCLDTIAALSVFAPRCNPWLRSDIQVGIHLLAGATRAAMATLAANRPEQALLAEGQALLDRLPAGA